MVDGDSDLPVDCQADPLVTVPARDQRASLSHGRSGPDHVTITAGPGAANREGGGEEGGARERKGESLREWGPGDREGEGEGEGEGE